jgi:hypothetical protein
MVILIAVPMWAGACTNRQEVEQGSEQVLNLTGRWSPAGSSRQDSHFKPNQYVIRKGLRRNALIIVAPVRIEASLEGIRGKANLKGWAAAVFNVGDGLQMNVYLRRSGTRRQIAGRYFDPGRKADDRNWIPLEIPLEVAEKDWLEIEISAGPQGDSVSDWLALSDLSLFKDPEL